MQSNHANLQTKRKNKKKEKSLVLLIPIPYNFTSVKKAANFIDDWKNWGINLQFEDGKTLAHHALDLSNKNLFCNKSEVISFSSLSPRTYLSKQHLLIKLLLSMDIDLTILDDYHKTPLDYFVRSLLPLYAPNKSFFIQKIFNIIIKKHSSLLKKSIYHFNINAKEISKIKKLLCYFPIYTIRVNDLLIDNLNINKTDQLNKTFAHYVLSMTNESLLYDYTIDKHFQIVELLLICHPDLSLKDNYNRTAIDYFLNSTIDLINQTHIVINNKTKLTYKTHSVKRNRLIKEFDTNLFQENKGGSDFKRNRILRLSGVVSDKIIHQPIKTTSDKQLYIKVFSLLIDNLHGKLLKKSFFTFKQDQRRILVSNLSQFPLFIENFDDVYNFIHSKKFATIDTQGQTYLHHAANLHNNTLFKNQNNQNRLRLIYLICYQSDGKLTTISDINKNNPLSIFITTLPQIQEIKEKNKLTFMKIASTLIRFTKSADHKIYINTLTNSNINDLQNLLKLFDNISVGDDKILFIEITKIINLLMAGSPRSL